MHGFGFEAPDPLFIMFSDRFESGVVFFAGDDDGEFALQACYGLESHFR